MGTLYPECDGGLLLSFEPSTQDTLPFKTVCQECFGGALTFINPGCAKIPCLVPNESCVSSSSSLYCTGTSPKVPLPPPLKTIKFGYKKGAPASLLLPSPTFSPFFPPPFSPKESSAQKREGLRRGSLAGLGRGIAAAAVFSHLIFMTRYDGGRK